MHLKGLRSSILTTTAASSTIYFGLCRGSVFRSTTQVKRYRILNFIRPYGTLGSVVPGAPSYLKFGASPPSDLFGMINRIRTFTESDVMHDKEKLSSALLGASLIVFLGFGFHPQNLKLLTLPADQQLRRAKVLATTLGIHSANLPELALVLRHALRVEGDLVETYPMAASQILQDLRMKITLAVG